jgi:hypothetical protein
MRLEGNHEELEEKDMEGGASDLFQGIIQLGRMKNIVIGRSTQSA